MIHFRRIPTTPWEGQPIDVLFQASDEARFTGRADHGFTRWLGGAVFVIVCAIAIAAFR